MRDLHGVFPALITPFGADGQVNEAALRQLVQLNLHKGVSGFYVGGSSAEAFLLTQEERRRILEIVTDETAGQAAVVAHIGCLSTDGAIALARHAEACGADALSSVAPFYYPYSFEEVKHYYFDILDSAGLPMVVYNFPGFSGVSLKLEQMAELTAHPRVIGVKHTSSDYFMLERLRDLRPDLLVYNGFDEMFLAGLGMGASGGIGSTYNFMAERFVKIRKLFLENDMQGALAEQKAVNRIIAAILKVGVIPGVKAAAEHLGIAAGPCRRPFRPLSEEQKAWLIDTIFG